MPKNVYLFFLILHCICDFSNSTPLVGEAVRKAHDNEFPFVVSLSFNNTKHVGREENNHVCGGILISLEHVLTAAHCFLHVKEPHDIVVKVGSRDLQRAESLEVAWWVYYKQWAENISISTTYHDVAIVKLRGRVISSESTSPAKLGFHRDAEFYGKPAITAGWGRVKYDEKPRYMRTASLDVLNAEQCLFKIRKFHNNHLKFYVPGSLLCTIATPPVLTKCGDSGGPLIFNGSEVIGVNLGACAVDSYAEAKEHQNYHASVNYYKKFILDVIRHRHETESVSNYT